MPGRAPTCRRCPFSGWIPTLELAERLPTHTVDVSLSLGVGHKPPTHVGDKGKQIVTHYAGSTWKARDGSTVVAARVDGITVSPSAIPWLLLRATSKTQRPDGDWLTNTTYIQRVNTTSA
jgi:hypothetical protein